MSNPPPPRIAALRLVPLGLLVLAGIIFVTLGGHHYISFAALAENREWLCRAVARGGPAAAALFVLAYAGIVALSIPGGFLLTMTSGFLFGPLFGTAYALVGATLGASIVFLAARAGFAGLTARAGPWARRFEAGFRNHALNYLLVLRLIPLIPFWLVNLLAAAVGLRLSVYVTGTLIGMIPVTFVLASLGSELGSVIAAGHAPGAETLLDPGIILPLLSLAALAMAPVAYRVWRARHGPKAA
jgi:uncharacterized membrane protein YdjX (TVP38/TMEM64 family)